MQEFKNFLKAATEGTERTVEFAQNVLEGNDGKEVKVTLVKKTEEPVRAESKARDHVFYCIPEFASYLVKYGTKDTVILADVDQRQIVAVLDEESKKGREVITLKPQYHPVFKPWKETPRIMGAKDFAKFVMRNRRTIVSPDGRELAITMSQIRVSQKVEIFAGTGKHCINGVTCEQTIKGQTQADLVEIPEEIIVEVPFFVGRKPRQFHVDINVDCYRDKNVKVEMSSPDTVEGMVLEFTEMLNDLQEITKDSKDLIIGHGELMYQRWSYIDKED